jgi:hypothetical protein
MPPVIAALKSANYRVKISEQCCTIAPPKAAQIHSFARTGS